MAQEAEAQTRPIRVSQSWAKSRPAARSDDPTGPGLRSSVSGSEHGPSRGRVRARSLGTRTTAPDLGTPSPGGRSCPPMRTALDAGAERAWRLSDPPIASGSGQDDVQRQPDPMEGRRVRARQLHEGLRARSETHALMIGVRSYSPGALHSKRASTTRCAPGSRRRAGLQSIHAAHRAMHHRASSIPASKPGPPRGFGARIPR